MKNLTAILALLNLAGAIWNVWICVAEPPKPINAAIAVLNFGAFILLKDQAND